ncbi:MAG TPA: DUF3500 domain-containing protein [Thermoanaerobaculia bacterium]|nr:DUF3500 domain-containing protein [Thermoanaerobaculia bacterium]
MRSIVAAASLLLLAAATTVDPLRAFLSSLSPSARRKALIRFSDDERFDWHYFPRWRSGLPIGDLNKDQTARLHSFLRANLGPAGHRKAAGVIELEAILGDREGSWFRSPGRYYFSLFGDPAAPPWGWRFEGHHLSLNVTQTPRGTSYTPMFLGANPSRVPSGARAGWELLRDEEHKGRAFLQSLDAGQRAKAIISARAPADIVTGTDRSFRLQKFEGLAASAMTERQRQALLALVRVYVDNAPQSIADAEIGKIRRAGIEKLHFAWAGGAQPGQPHYYRIHGPTVLIEYDNTFGNHIHTVWRNPHGDFGDDVLARHYAEAAHHAPDESWVRE